MADKNLDILDRAKGALLGLACGDAVGTTLEFSIPGSFAKLNDMVGGGPFNLKPGEWTDDTSMALCLAESLIESKGFSEKDQMDRYLRWYDHGYLSSNGKCFDIGKTVREALEKFRNTGNPSAGSTDEYSAGNGSLMRLAPVPLFFFPDHEKIIEYSGKSSVTTHGATECIDACKYFGFILYRCLQGYDKDDIFAVDQHFNGYCQNIQRIAAGSFKKKTEREVKGSGYVVESLEAALWAFYHSSNFKEAILHAVNLGRDADTTGAICGQIAGAFWGRSAIPENWCQKIVMRNKIEKLAELLINFELKKDSI